jgi:hypothetical protein
MIRNPGLHDALPESGLFLDWEQSGPDFEIDAEIYKPPR